MRVRKGAKRPGEMADAPPGAGAKPAFRDLVAGPLLNKLFSKFSERGPQRVSIALEEVIRFLQLSAASPSPIFFPGDKLMDDLWHALIVETAEYRELCDKLRPGCFIDHSGILFDDYLLRKTVPEIHEEQMSWLVSYVSNFGPISEAAFPHLILARSLCERMNIDLKKLNALAVALHSRTAAHAGDRGSLDDHLKLISGAAAARIGREPGALREALLGIIGTVSQPMGNSQLEAIFAASTALGFTIWQHLAAMERLTLAEGWQAENAELWMKLKQGSEFVGLATTHLANAENIHVRAEAIGKGAFELSGTLPWVTGHGIFSRLIVGFRLGEEFVFALVDFPCLGKAGGVEVEMVDLGCLQGTATVKIHLDKGVVRGEQIIGRRPIKSSVAKSRSTYAFPDLGIAKAALTECDRLIGTRSSLSPRDLEARLEPVRRLYARVQALRESAASGPVTDNEHFLKDECIRDSVRLLALTSGGNSLCRESLAFRLQQEILLLDAVIQPVSARMMKLDKASRG